MKIDRVGLFHCKSGVGSAWNCAEGISNCLSRKGYHVVDFGDPREKFVDFSTLRSVDLIFMSALDWYHELISEYYGDNWKKLTIPKIAWYAESCHRDDRDFDFHKCQPLADLHYYPAIQDADEFNGHWLPFGVDVEIFKPEAIEQKIDVAFLGSMYAKRQEYCSKILYPITHILPVFGSTPIESVKALASAYCHPKIFLNLPSLSRLLVTKVTEVMACGTMLMTPKIDHSTALRNMDQFIDKKHLVYYDADNPGQLGEIIQYYIENPKEREEIAYNGYCEVINSHTLNHRIDKIFADIDF